MLRQQEQHAVAGREPHAAQAGQQLLGVPEQIAVRLVALRAVGRHVGQPTPGTAAADRGTAQHVAQRGGPARVVRGQRAAVGNGPAAAGHDRGARQARPARALRIGAPPARGAARAPGVRRRAGGCRPGRGSRTSAATVRHTGGPAHQLLPRCGARGVGSGCAVRVPRSGEPVRQIGDRGDRHERRRAGHAAGHRDARGARRRRPRKRRTT
jgi:hypothetical protein